MQKISVTLESNESHRVDYGTRADEVLGLEEQPPGSPPIVAAMVNNEVVSVSFKVEVNATVLPVRLGTVEGARVFRRSLCFLLTVAAENLFPDRRIVIGHSLGDGYYYYFDGMDQVSRSDTDAIETKMRELVQADLPIVRRVLSYADALHYLERIGLRSALSLLEHRNESKVPIYECEDFCDISHGPLVPSTGMLAPFEIENHTPGFLLRYPEATMVTQIKPFVPQPVVFSIFQEYKEWGGVLGISSAGQLNTRIRQGDIDDFIRVAEALHNKKIASIADLIDRREHPARIVLIAGPSSSGKTTFTKKLSIQLRVLGYDPAIISTDNFFLSREETPRDAFGEYDFESIDALDRERLNNDLIELLDSGRCELPVFDFKSGRRSAKRKLIELGTSGIVLIEGIHGLNPRLTEDVEKDEIFRVYISALTQLNIDDHNRIPTTDVRLIRRMVRDFQFRGYTAEQTIERWPSVRRGENNNIFPFESFADIAFNSSLDYELPVLKGLAEPLLRTIKPYDSLYNEGVRLLRFLSNFVGIPTKLVPGDSILREFIGDSSFEY